jgi:hypothetical protein
MHAKPPYGVAHDPHRRRGVDIKGMRERVRAKGWAEGLWVWVIIRKSPKAEESFEEVFILRQILPYRTRHTLHGWDARCSIQIHLLPYQKKKVLTGIDGDRRYLRYIEVITVVSPGP